MSRDCRLLRGARARARCARKFRETLHIDPGIAAYRRRFGWKERIPLDDHEQWQSPQRPPLPFLIELARKLPRKWDAKRQRFAPADDGLLWGLQPGKGRGKHLERIRR